MFCEEDAFLRVIKAESEAIPVVKETNSLVVGSTLAACIMAEKMSSKGNVTIVTRDTSFPFEHVVCRRPWAKKRDINKLPAKFKKAYLSSIEEEKKDEVILNLAILAIKIEDILLDAGVEIFYGQAPCGTVGKETVGAVVFGGKQGLLAFKADKVIDCTSEAVVAGLAGGKVESRLKKGGEIDVAFSAKITLGDIPQVSKGTRGNEHLQQYVPAGGKLKDKKYVLKSSEILKDKAILMHGPYAEINIKVPVDSYNDAVPGSLSGRVRQLIIESGAELNKIRKAKKQPLLFFFRFPGGLLTGPVKKITAEKKNPYLVKGVKNVWVFSSAADVGKVEAEKLNNPFAAAGEAVKLAGKINRSGAVRFSGTVKAVLAGDLSWNKKTETGLLCFSDGRQLLHSTGKSVKAGAVTLPVLAECEVLVAGAGTSGVPAALTAAKEGADTILIEPQADLGGTRTVGGVGNYWFGRFTEGLKRFDKEIDQTVRKSGVAEEVGMLAALQKNGVRVFAAAPVAGVIKKGKEITGVVVVTAKGLGVVKGKVVIDSTGDGDIAAWAGVSFDYGNGRDAWTIWGSFANFNRARMTASRQYESTIEISDPVDFNRTIITSRRRPGMWKRFAPEMPQHYVAPRETRRIKAAETVTYQGILAGKNYPDTMVVADSNFDIKGIATSDLLCCGLMWAWSYHIRYLAVIPYSATLAEGVDNLLVACRAYSASHDAMSLARMQADMLNLGIAAAAAAAISVKQNKALDKLRLKDLKAAWLRLGSIKKSDHTRFAAKEKQYTAASAVKDIKALAAGKGNAVKLQARIAGSKTSIAPLKKAFKKAKDKLNKTRFARLLCFFGDSTGVDYLLEDVEKQIANTLPRPRSRTLSMPPEHGWSGEPVFSLYAVASAGKGSKAVPLLEKIADMVCDDDEIYSARSESPFEYARVVCCVAERCPSKKMIPALEVLLSKKSLSNQDMPVSGDIRKATDSIAERRSYLELSIARALARCGERKGYEILLKYIDDVRGCLARSAVDELVELIGKPKDDSLSGWRRHLKAQKKLAIKPYRKSID
ncbi:MAG: FAD-dependent oxidoreductase [Planctomycetota bacterium]|jgi:hypothetical protein